MPIHGAFPDLADLSKIVFYVPPYVTDPEPLPHGHALRGAPNAIITPHIGGDISAFMPRAPKLIQEWLVRFAKGELLKNIVAGPLR